MTYGEILQSRAGEEAALDVDLYVINDNLSLDTISKLRETTVFNPEKAVIIIDQIVPPNSPETSAVQRQLMQLSKEQGIEIYYGTTMTSQYLTDKVRKRQIVAGCNPAVITAGICGAMGVCVDEDCVPEVYATGKVTVTVPECIGLSMKNTENPVSLKDGVLQLLETADKSQFRNGLAVLDKKEFSQYTAGSCIGFFTLLTKLGVFSAVMDAHIEVDRVVELDAKVTVPMAASNEDSGLLCPISELEQKKVNVVFIGGSTGGNFSQIEAVAKAVKGKQIAYGLRLSVAPASSEVYKQMTRAGYVSDILDAGGQVLNQCADPEIQCRVGVKEVMVSNDWKNDPGYAGYEDSLVILTSTATAVEAALTGTIGTKGLDAETLRQADSGQTDDGQPEPIIIEGKCWKFGDDIDTDIIIPTQWCCVPMEELKHHVFEPLRPGLADILQDGDIIVAGENFGCGSSREMAAEGIKENGVRCIIAKSFARIFFRNAINNGILLIECPELPDHVNEGDMVRVELNHQITCGEKVYPIGRIQQNLYEIIADGGLVRNIEKKVKRGEL